MSIYIQTIDKEAASVIPSLHSFWRKLVLARGSKRQTLSRKLTLHYENINRFFKQNQINCCCFYELQFMKIIRLYSKIVQY